MLKPVAPKSIQLQPGQQALIDLSRQRDRGADGRGCRPDHFIAFAPQIWSTSVRSRIVKASATGDRMRTKPHWRRGVPHRPSCHECPLLGPRGQCRDGVYRKSGRCGDWVWYVSHGKQFRRRWVLPKDRRTARQRRWRARLGFASKRYSHTLPEAQQNARTATAAKRRTRRRMGQSGPLTGQQYSVSKECKAIGRAERRRSIINTAKVLHSQSLAKSSSSQLPQRQRLTRATWEQHRGASRYTPEQRHADKRRGR